MNKKVTERDFRKPEFKDANPEDYEFRADGVIVRKDRWEKTVREIANIIGVDPREGFECDMIIFSLRKFVKSANEAGLEPVYFSEVPNSPPTGKTAHTHTG